jgi:Cu+-exporting ATPase
MVGTGRGARRGILFTSGDSLETAHSVSTVLLDKTGTVTTGKPVVTNVLVEPGFNEQEVLQVAASLETLTNHPFAVAILRLFQEKGGIMLPVEDFEAVTGKGVYGRINGQLVRVGNAAYLKETGISPATSTMKEVLAISETGKTPLFVAKEDRLLGVIFVADTLRPGIKEAVSTLLHAGKQVIMLTGDHAATANAIAREAGISEVRSDLLPQDKERIVAEYRSKGQKVAMVGDGINDAPALASADVGIAMGAGTDIALSSADVVLMRNDLSAINDLFLLSRKVSATIKQNLFWAFFYNILGIPLAAGVFYLSWGKLLNPEVAAAAMSLSSVTVVLNALRLNRLFRGKTVTSNKRSDETVIFDAMNQSKLETPMKTTILRIEGMSCGHCSATVEKALNAFDGVKAYVDLTSNTATIYHPDNLSTEELAKAVDNAGYKVV